MLQQLRKLIVPNGTSRLIGSYAQPSSWCVEANSSGFSCSGVEPVVIGDLHFVGDVWLSNAPSLRKKYDLRVGNDLEILCHLWSQQGESMLSEIEGAFCFVCWDASSKELQMVRDPVGVRTLYVAKESSRTLIAPKLHTISNLVKRRIDPIALKDYLSCAFVPGERTLLHNVFEVRPGTVCTLSESRNYWTIQENYQNAAQESLEWHASKLRELLETVINEYLPANSDVGCYLSGGLDSSSVAALATRLHNRQVHCFSIHFGDECPNELEFSRMVADHCGAQHHVIQISPEEMWELHAETLSLLDDPIGDPLTVPNFILGKKAKQFTDVILNGEGGDPCFGGPKNQPMMLESLYQSAHGGTTRSRDLVSAYLASFQKCSTDLHRLLLPSTLRALSDAESVFEQDLRSEGHYVNKLFLINTKYKGADHILTKVNNITSALQLFGRSPLFDRRVVDMSLSIPPQYKLKGAQEKAVLKAAVADLLPERILTRPKSGMMVPVQLWYRKHWNARARKLLLSKNARIAESLDQQVIKEWLDYRGDVWARYGVKLWLLTALETWMQVHDVS